MQTLFQGEVSERGPNDYASQYAGLLLATLGVGEVLLLRGRDWNATFAGAAIALLALLAAMWVCYVRRFQPAFERLPDEAQEFRHALSRLVHDVSIGPFALGILAQKPDTRMETAVLAAFVVATLTAAGWIIARREWPAYVAFRQDHAASARLFTEVLWAGGMGTALCAAILLSS